MGWQSGAWRVAGFHRSGGFEEQHVRFLVRHWTMLHATRHDEEFPFVEHDLFITEEHADAPPNHEEQFVLVLMRVPDEVAEEFPQTHHLSVEITRHARRPIVFDGREFLFQIDRSHAQLRWLCFNIVGNPALSVYF